MCWFDRVLLLALVLGVWVLVLKPSTLPAHNDNYHSCSFFWEGGYGEWANGRMVNVYSGNGSVNCSHF